ncbi:hypothetical protein GW17_00052205 [Ensete ventricosum]|nr:hypothetical protein GW17_00052205 [Ensete ventricosum]
MVDRIPGLTSGDALDMVDQYGWPRFVRSEWLASISSGWCGPGMWCTITHQCVWESAGVTARWSIWPSRPRWLGSTSGHSATVIC